MADPGLCVFCRTGHRLPGETTKTLTRGDVTMVVHHVPAEICDNCHEAYFDQVVAGELLTIFEAAVAAGVKMQVRNYMG